MKQVLRGGETEEEEERTCDKDEAEDDYNEEE